MSRVSYGEVANGKSLITCRMSSGIMLITTLRNDSQPSDVHILRDPAYLGSCTPANPELVLRPEENLPLLGMIRKFSINFLCFKKKKQKKLQTDAFGWALIGMLPQSFFHSYWRSKVSLHFGLLVPMCLSGYGSRTPTLSHLRADTNKWLVLLPMR